MLCIHSLLIATLLLQRSVWSFGLLVRTCSAVRTLAWQRVICEMSIADRLLASPYDTHIRNVEVGVVRCWCCLLVKKLFSISLLRARPCNVR